jgi:hypothetical protein
MMCVELCESFLGVSQALLDDGSLEPSDAEGFLELLVAPDAEYLGPLLEKWRARPPDVPAQQWLLDAIWPEETLRGICMDVTSTWLFGGPVKGGKSIATPPHLAVLRTRMYFRARFWGLVRAHPPGLSGGYFGHWTYEAEP